MEQGGSRSAHSPRATREGAAEWEGSARTTDGTSTSHAQHQSRGLVDEASNEYQSAQAYHTSYAAKVQTSDARKAKV